ncbi:hypothetical protein ATN84_00295 [Paramesorhizobium deserti]|uniref:Uncharacterized protein n=1 Tax=Paramesorhizobium deserti TaxID=1494590 RepID=A0A135HYK5_9HYPH|nr:DUF6107 family protein [Paramesorhizobium deserti]KXF78282.1 hypothetical protein ATN84_00295 [Paramesorhizobium deserti]
MSAFQEMGDTAWVLLAKAAGAVAGSAVSLAYMLPKGKQEAAIRFAVGIICGLVFGGAAGVKIAEELAIDGSLGKAELMLMGSAAASLAAWSALGIFNRFAERMKAAPLPDFIPERQERKVRDEG